MKKLYAYLGAITIFAGQPALAGLDLFETITVPVESVRQDRRLRSLPEPRSHSIMSDHVDYNSHGLMAGFGYDAVSGSAMGECVDYRDLTPFSGVETLFEIKQIENTRNLNEEINLSASASLKFLSGLGGSLKVQYAFNREISLYSTFVMVKTIVRAPIMIARGARINSDYATLLAAPGGETTFRQACGDYWVSGYVSGGEFYGVIQINSSSIDEKKALEADLKVSYGIFDSSATFKQRLQEVVKNREVIIRAYQGGGTPQILAPSPEGLIQLATTFPTQFLDAKGAYNQSGVVYQLQLKPYATLPRPPGSVTSPIVAHNQLEVLNRFNDYAVAFTDQLNSINYALKYPERFQSPDRDDLLKKRAEIINMKNRTVLAAKQCFFDSLQCLDDPTITFTQVELPKLKDASSCETPIWNEKADAECGYVFNQGTGSECGQACTTKPDARCGIKSYKAGTGPVCPAIFRLARHASCGVERTETHCVTDYRCGIEGTQPKTCCKTVNIYRVCRSPDNGIEQYSTCEHPNFGVAEYLSCEVCDGFRSCQHPNFGIREVKRCRLQKFGLERCSDSVVR